MSAILQAGASSPQQGLDAVLDALRGDACVYFPIRHHSPACAWHLAKLIRELKPASILVEGPASFTPLIPAILDAETRAPIAIYTHFVDVDRTLYKPPGGEPDLGPARYAAYYPFCDYSPELIALRVGTECGAMVEFIDLDYADQVLAEHHAAVKTFRPRIETLLREQHLQRSHYLKLLAERSGCRDFNEMWDHCFEADFRARSTDAFMRDVAAYCYFARIDTAQESLEADGTLAREARMAVAIDKAIAAQHAGPVLVVTGGFHTVALPFMAGKGASLAAAQRRSSDSVQQALIRYSFEQLDALNGYQSGMPSPNYYNQLWQAIDAGNPEPYGQIATSILVEIGSITRQNDMQVALSVADEIAALQQASLLAAFRGHPGPLREDLLDGVRSCFVKGGMDAEGTVLMSLVAHVLSGKEIGSVPATAGAPPIVNSFRKEAERARLDISDSVKRRVSLELYRRPEHRRTSRLLHSLSFLGVPFAQVVAGPDFVRGKGLDRIHEHWTYSWSPMTDGGLVGAAVYGSTVEEASSNRLRETIARLDEEGNGRSAAVAVSMLIHACRMGLHRHAGNLLALIAAKISEEPSFNGAASAANQLLMLWQSREPLEAHSLGEVPQLLRAAYLRGCYLTPNLAQCPEDELATALESLNVLRELLVAAPKDLLDPEIFWEAAERILSEPNQQHAPYSTIAGGVAGLLHSAGRMSTESLDALAIGALVGISDSQRRVGFLRGLMKTCREVAWQNTSLLNSLDGILTEWDEPEFIAALPSLRLALADLTPRETDRVAALVASLHGESSLGEVLHLQMTESELERNRRITAMVLDSLEADGLGAWLKEVPK
jgi:Family of unknown function (DUF5682)